MLRRRIFISFRESLLICHKYTRATKICIPNFSRYNLVKPFEIINPAVSANDLCLSRMWKRFPCMHSLDYLLDERLWIFQIFLSALFKIETFFCNWRTTTRAEIFDQNEYSYLLETNFIPLFHLVWRDGVLSKTDDSKRWFYKTCHRRSQENERHEDARMNHCLRVLEPLKCCSKIKSEIRDDGKLPKFLRKQDYCKSSFSQDNQKFPLCSSLKRTSLNLWTDIIFVRFIVIIKHEMKKKTQSAYMELQLRDEQIFWAWRRCKGPVTQLNL